MCNDNNDINKFELVTEVLKKEKKYIIENRNKQLEDVKNRYEKELKKIIKSHRLI